MVVSTKFHYGQLELERFLRKRFKIVRLFHVKKSRSFLFFLLCVKECLKECLKECSACGKRCNLANYLNFLGAPVSRLHKQGVATAQARCRDCTSKVSRLHKQGVATTQATTIRKLDCVIYWPTLNPSCLTNNFIFSAS
jgi:hypothetical protein